jgi:hypothetical protein
MAAAGTQIAPKPANQSLERLVFSLSSDIFRFIDLRILSPRSLMQFLPPSVESNHVHLACISVLLTVSQLYPFFYLFQETYFP